MIKVFVEDVAAYDDNKDDTLLGFMYFEVLPRVGDNIFFGYIDSNSKEVHVNKTVIEVSHQPIDNHAIADASRVHCGYNVRLKVSD
jgi:hypothetical protein